MSDQDAAPEPASLGDGSILLLPIQPEHFEFLYHLAVAEEFGFRWRHGGMTPPYDGFVQHIWSRILVQFVVTEAISGHALGLAMAYDPDLRSGHVFVSTVLLADEVPDWGATHDRCTRLLVNYVFTTWDLNKIYMEVPEFRWGELMPQLSESGFEEEGRLADHRYFDGRLWSVQHLSQRRESWQRLQQR